MKFRRHILSLALVTCCVALPLGCLKLASAFSALRLASAGAEMTTAGEAFTKTLSPEQKAKAVLAYDVPTRTDWHYIPKPTRKGLQVKEMDEAQRKAALELLHSALSAIGYGKATKIMELESILHELEKTKTNGMIRDPQRYYFTLFGPPSAAGRWGLSIEGHHLSLNFVVDRNKVISSTPTFFGANPGKLLADYGPEFKKGLRVLAKEEELAYELLNSLSPEQRKTAIVDEKAPTDVRDAGKAAPPKSEAEGLAVRDMSRPQVQILRALISEYAHNLPSDVAEERLSAIEKEGYDGIKFVWRGSDKEGTGHDYRIQGPTFLIEFNNTQPDSAGNLANHVHSVWHNLAGNFALPVGGK